MYELESILVNKVNAVSTRNTFVALLEGDTQEREKHYETLYLPPRG